MKILSTSLTNKSSRDARGTQESAVDRACRLFLHP